MVIGAAPSGGVPITCMAIVTKLPPAMLWIGVLLYNSIPICPVRWFTDTCICQPVPSSGSVPIDTSDEITLKTFGS